LIGRQTKHITMVNRRFAARRAMLIAAALCILSGAHHVTSFSVIAEAISAHGGRLPVRRSFNSLSTKPSPSAFPFSVRNRGLNIFTLLSSRLSSLAAVKEQKQHKRRKELLSRNGSFFKCNRVEGDIEFGSTVELV
jgi:hypothetical protein